MGGFLSINMEENFKKNQEFIQTINKIKMERQIQLQFQIQERQMAMQIARNRDLCFWITAFYVTAGTGLITGFRRTKKPFLLVPLVPLTFVTLYHWDLAYGNKIHRIRMEAEHIMTHEADTLEWPCGLPSPSSVDLGRLYEEEKKKIHPPLI
ncbi:plasminogen receptor (KT) [Plodia interpunctella]|uniref:plasminogen receptor (KT) n=1 Tax=Plodia interpunctella TaxID=58824 RepID=UPI002367C0C3|nr:plasminogen receptor (KT) [Plodia interpunctella]